MELCHRSVTMHYSLLDLSSARFIMCLIICFLIRVIVNWWINHEKSDDISEPLCENREFDNKLYWPWLNEEGWIFLKWRCEDCLLCHFMGNSFLNRTHKLIRMVFCTFYKSYDAHFHFLLVFLCNFCQGWIWFALLCFALIS